MDWAGWPVNWPAHTHSPDLSCLDSFLWDHMKSLVYASPVDFDEALIARIAVVAGEIREMPEVFASSTFPPPVATTTQNAFKFELNILEEEGNGMEVNNIEFERAIKVREEGGRAQRAPTEVIFNN
ncbi:uncharacterized protein TNCV_448911 [Trichonephila clavipes]|nr:uncharacterized protein TNCV_448911 [Trichonephila clavipes]